MNASSRHDMRVPPDRPGPACSELTGGSGTASDLHRRRLPRLSPGTVIAGKYLVGRALGVGGWAVVYEAEHLTLGHRVAIKVLHVEDVSPSVSTARFRREARLSAAAHHRYVLQVYDMGHLQDGSPYLVMERLHGEDLSRRLDRGGLSIAAVFELGDQLLSALAGLADRGIVHRDIKPHNIVLHRDSDGQTVLKLLDFGISTADLLPAADRGLTGDGMVVGTPHYMAPEQVLGHAVDHRADLYAASVVLYEALAGVPPFDDAATGALLASVLRDDVPSLRRYRHNCPPSLERILRKGLSKDPEERYSHPQAMRRHLVASARALGLPSGNEAWSHRDDGTPPRVEAWDRVALGVGRCLEAFRRPQSHLQRALLVGLLGFVLGGAGGALAVGGPRAPATDAAAHSEPAVTPVGVATDSSPPWAPEPDRLVPAVLECREPASLRPPGP